MRIISYLLNVNRTGLVQGVLRKYGYLFRLISLTSEFHFHRLQHVENASTKKYVEIICSYTRSDHKLFAALQCDAVDFVFEPSYASVIGDGGPVSIVRSVMPVDR